MDEYKIVCSDGTEETLKAPSDGVPLSKTLNLALSTDSEKVWKLYLLPQTDAGFDELLFTVTRETDGTITTEVNR